VTHRPQFARRLSPHVRLAFVLMTAVILVSIIAPFLAGPPHVALALGTFDQSYDPGGSAATVPSNITSTTQRLAQTITVGATGLLDGVAFYVTRTGSSGTVVFEIQSTSGGSPTGTVLATGTLLESSVPTSIGGGTTIPFSPGAFVVAGTAYAIVISAPSLAGGASVHINVHSPGTYPGGDFFSDSGSGFVSTGNDASFADFITAATATPTSTATPTATVTSTVTLTPTATATLPSTATPTGTLPAVTTATTTPTVTVTPDNTATTIPGPVQTGNKEDSPKPKTEEQRRQEQHTNKGNRDDEYTEGNVDEVGQDGQGPFVVLGNRDGNMVVRLQCGSQCPTIKVGDYIEVDGTKEHEQLFYADEVTVTR
jgi:hypothetical protein